MQDSIITIRTMDCDMCGKYDSIMLTTEEIKIRSNTTDMNIGAYSISHNDHTRIIYFDELGKYLGDTIALSESEVPENLQTEPLPFYIRNETSSSWIKKIRKSIFSFFHSKNLTITITGPSRAGKTSFAKYLETLVPESSRPIVDSVPTMGKSSKIIKIGKTTIKTLDMGGQQDFWDLWDNSIELSDAIIFILDATSNNQLEVARAFERVIQYRKKDVPILVIMNKKDLVLKGNASKFVSSGEFLALSQLKLPIKNVISIEASIFEGIAYMKSNLEEIPLIEVIISYFNDYC